MLLADLICMRPVAACCMSLPSFVGAVAKVRDQSCARRVFSTAMSRSTVPRQPSDPSCGSRSTPSAPSANAQDPGLRRAIGCYVRGAPGLTTSNKKLVYSNKGIATNGAIGRYVHLLCESQGPTCITSSRPGNACSGPRSRNHGLLCGTHQAC